jgi:hypothetical protein
MSKVNENYGRNFQFWFCYISFWLAFLWSLYAHGCFDSWLCCQAYFSAVCYLFQQAVLLI